MSTKIRIATPKRETDPKEQRDFKGKSTKTRIATEFMRLIRLFKLHIARESPLKQGFDLKYPRKYHVNCCKIAKDSPLK